MPSWGAMPDPTRTAIGTWSGGRFMHFGEPLDDERLIALLRPDERTAHRHHRRRLRRRRGRRAARPRARRRRRATATASSAPSATTSTRASARAPRASRASPTRACAAPDGYARLPAHGDRALARAHRRRRVRPAAAAQPRPHRATRARRCGTGMAALRDAGLTRRLGVAPGPGERLHARPDRLLRALRRAARLGDGHPQPARAVARRAGAATPPRTTTSALITRVVDYGGLFHDDVLPGHAFPQYDHRGFRPAGWVERGREKLERMRPDRRAPRAHAAAARLPVEPRARAGRAASPRR